MRTRNRRRTQSGWIRQLGDWIRAGWRVLAASPLQEGSPFRRLCWGLLFLVLLSALFISSLTSEQLDVDVGDTAPYDLRAESDFVDESATDELRREAMEQVPDVYEQDPGVGGRATAEFEEVMGRLADLRTRSVLLENNGVELLAAERADHVRNLRDFWPTRITDEEATVLLTAPESEFSAAAESLRDTYHALFAEGVKAESLEPHRERLLATVTGNGESGGVASIIGAMGSDLLRPNLLFNAAETQRRKDLAGEEVAPVTVRRGEIIVSGGATITANDMVRIEQAGLLDAGVQWQIYTGAVLYALLLLVLIATYLARFRPEILASESKLVLAGLVFIVILFVCRFAVELSPFLMPVAAGTMLLGILLDGSTSLVFGLAMGLSSAVMVGGDVDAVVVSVVGATVAAMASDGIEERTDMMRTGIGVGVANVVALLALAQQAGGISAPDLTLWGNVLWAGANGIVSAVVAIGVLPFLETFFGILTPVKLLELANPHHPLMRLLLESAPGTYHHSMTVANLAESAAEEVGGDSLFTRVGAYYHDIGKARRPYFFIENQFGGENPHDKLSPNLSALIIISHVKDGIDMAEDYGLPSAIVEFIREHHGTRRVSYFYARAREDSEEDVPEDNYRYPGPRPQSKEVAVVMLADSVEAAVRSLARPTPDRIRGVVRNIIHDRLEDGQLDKCDLTFRDLDLVCDTFTRVLSGAFHHRLEYPESLLAEVKEEDVDGHDHRSDEQKWRSEVSEDR